MIAEFLLHPVYECGRRISATSSVWVVAEFLQHPVYESLQNFCYIHCIKGRRISATPSVWVVANLVSAISNVRVLTEFLRRLVYKWPQNFWYIQCMSDCRISAPSTVWVVAKFLQHLVYESHLPQSISSVSLVNSRTGHKVHLILLYWNLLLIYNRGSGEYGDFIHDNISLVSCKESNVRFFPISACCNWYIGIDKWNSVLFN